MGKDKGLHLTATVYKFMWMAQDLLTAPSGSVPRGLGVQP